MVGVWIRFLKNLLNSKRIQTDDADLIKNVRYWETTLDIYTPFNSNYSSKTQNTNLQNYPQTSNKFFFTQFLDWKNNKKIGEVEQSKKEKTHITKLKFKSRWKLGGKNRKEIRYHHDVRGGVTGEMISVRAVAEEVSMVCSWGLRREIMREALQQWEHEPKLSIHNKLLTIPFFFFFWFSL